MTSLRCLPVSAGISRIRLWCVVVRAACVQVMKSPASRCALSFHGVRYAVILLSCPALRAFSSSFPSAPPMQPRSVGRVCANVSIPLPIFPFRECRPVVCRFFYEFKQSQLFLVSSPALEVEYSQLSHVMVVPHLLFYMYNNIARLFLLFSAVFSWFLSKFNIIELRKTLFQSPHAYSSASCSIIADLASFMCFIT